MPCDTVQTTTVEFGKNTDRKLLVQALTELRIQGYSIDTENNLTLPRYEAGKLQQIRREYSKQVVVAQALKFGFKVAPLAEGKKGVQHVRV